MTTQRPQRANTLSQHYYHENFNELISFVGDNYWHLLDQCETEFFNTYHTLGQSAQQLYCRLLMRTREYVRASQTTYSEIADTGTALAELIDNGFCTAVKHDDVQSWITLFRRDELRSTMPALSCSQSPSHAINNDWLENSDESRELLSQKDLFGFSPVELLLQTDDVFRIVHKASFINFQLLFFGDLYQDLSAFVLRDLGYTRYETTLRNNLPFTARAQLLAHRHYYDCISQYDDSIKASPDALVELHQHLSAISTEIVHSDATLQRRIDKWSNRIARQLERLGAWDYAAAIYYTSSRPPARERLARIKSQQNQKADALSICRTIIKDPLDGAELDFAEQFGLTVAKALGEDFPVVGKYKPKQIPLTLTASALSVEFATALHFAKTGKCFYVENSLITGMFGLAMWDIIFAPVDGAFYHPFQIAPADFHDPGFADRRRHLITTRMDEIKRCGLAAAVLPNLHLKQGISNPLVNWFAMDRQLVILAIEQIPITHWLSLFTQLLLDIPAHRSGLPDLIYFANTGGYELLEVKGPGDQLQKNQRRWMKHFAASDIPHAVVNVEFVSSETNSTYTLGDSA